MQDSAGASEVERRGKILLTLVHGTFATKAEWVRSAAEGEFRNRLEAALARKVQGYEVEFDDTYPGWSGGNTWEGRIDGGETLRAYLETSTEEGVERFVVAHSHGGNVALYALRDGPPAGFRGLVCLATPFLVSQPRELPPTLMTASFLFLVGVAAIGDIELWQRGLLVAIATLYGAAVALMIVTRARLRLQRTTEGSEGLELREILEQRSLGKPTWPLLIVRTPGDEAEGTLRISQVSTSTLSRIWSVLDRTLGLLIGIGAIGVLLRSEESKPVLTWLGWTAAHTRIDRWLNSWMDPVMGALLGAAALVVVLLILLRLAFGFDAIRWVASVETGVERTPPGVEVEPQVLDPEPSRRGLKHSVYEHRETPEKLASWMRGVLQKRLDRTAVSDRRPPPVGPPLGGE